MKEHEKIKKRREEVEIKNTLIKLFGWVEKGEKETYDDPVKFLKRCYHDHYSLKQAHEGLIDQLMNVLYPGPNAIAQNSPMEYKSIQQEINEKYFKIDMIVVKASVNAESVYLGGGDNE